MIKEITTHFLPTFMPEEPNFFNRIRRKYTCHMVKAVLSVRFFHIYLNSSVFFHL